jgi:hypothetical protein
MRTYDATVHNIIANHPANVGFLDWKPEDHPETDGLLLFDNLAAEPEYYALLHNGDREFTFEEIAAAKAEGRELDLPGLALLLEWSAPGVWEIHTMSHPDKRVDMVGEARKLLAEMFLEHGAEMLWGRCPVHNPRIAAFYAKLGAKPAGSGHHSISGDVTYVRGYREEWLQDHWLPNQPSAPQA